MKPLKTNSNGELTKNDINYFGGQFSFWEKIKKKGIGSPKLIYEAGVEEFNKINRGIQGEIGFVNFELLKNGLILRLNVNQRHSCLGVRLSDVKAINLVAYRIEIKYRQLGKVISKIVHRGELEIVEVNGRIMFTIVSRELSGITAFFEKEDFRERFHYSISTNPIEKDYGYLLKFLDVFF